MPIKCAGAPQKAMYLSCDYWQRQGVLDKIEVEFDSAGAVLFGVADFVPPLMEYVRKYHANLVFNSNLVKVNGPEKIATFEIKNEAGKLRAWINPSICCMSHHPRQHRISCVIVRWQMPVVTVKLTQNVATYPFR